MKHQNSVFLTTYAVLFHAIFLIGLSSPLAALCEDDTASDSQLKKLCHLKLSIAQRSARYKKFGDQDRLVLDKLREKLIGMSKSEVLAMLGKPYTRNRALLWPILEEGETAFVYFWGTEPDVLRVFFRKEICTCALVHPYNEDFFYNKWRIDNLLKNAKGQTLREIFKVEGPACKTNWIVNDQTGTVTYQFGVDTAIQLTFEKGLCLDAQLSGFSVAMGMPNHHRESYQAYFRNP
jgi:hypothetical protein